LQNNPPECHDLGFPSTEQELDMIFASPPASRRTLLCLSALFLPGCAGTLPEVGPGDIPRLEQRVAASPDNTGLQVQLGMAQFKAGDFEAARGNLQSAIEAGNDSGAAYLYLGMVQEELEDWSAARAASSTYLEVGASTEARGEVRKRLTLIGRNLLRAQARQALAQEAEITSTASVTPRSVAVLPLGFNSANAELEPLIYALADMMVTDFKVSDALTVLERTQIQSLLDEMALTSAGYAEPGTGARAGRLLRAEHVFQGVLTTIGTDLQTEADILNVPNTASAGQVSASAVLDQLFDMEKDIVIRTIRDVLGIELTPAEEQAILENRIRNVLAFLAYGRGLRELDRGNYAAAFTEFQTSVQLEGRGFDGAEVGMATASALGESQNTSTTDLAGVAGSSGETGAGLFGPPAANTVAGGGDAGLAPRPPVGSGASGQTQSTGVGIRLNTLRNATEGVNPTPTAATLDIGSARQGQDQTTQQTNSTGRDPVQEGSGDGGVTSTASAQIRIVIRRPGGQQ
jgi:tetratricopeptide (TPR) repeat protein